jgi:hypothetical protein
VSSVSAGAGVEAYERTAQHLEQAVASSQAMSKQMAEYDVVFRRDPMRPLVDSQGRLVSSAGLHGGLSIQGIIWSPDRPLAVIDGELFAAGQVVGPYAIQQIFGDGIIVRKQDGEQLFIPLDQGLETPPAETVAPSQLRKPQ